MFINILTDMYLKKQILIALCLYLGQSLVGYGVGWTAPITLKLQDAEQTPLHDVITNREASFVGSSICTGAFIGPPLFGFFSNRFGRKPCLILGGLLALISFLLVITTKNLAMVYTLRIVKGVGLGMIAISNLVYIGEIASSNIRGVLLTATGIFTTLGTLIMFSVGPYVSYKATGYIGGFLTLAYLVILFFIPETPVYKILKGKEDEAKIILESLGRYQDLEEVTSTTKALKIKSKNKATLLELFTDKSNKRALIILITLNIFQQMSGVIAVLFFATKIFTLAGSSVRPDIATVIIGLTQLVSSCIAPLFVDKYGRKILLLLSSLICTGSMTVFGVYFFFYERGYTVANSMGWVPLMSLIIFFLTYGFGLGIIPNTLGGEMFNLNMRSSGTALALTVGWLAGFVLVTVFNDMIPTIGASITFWIFATSCALASVVTIFFVPETKGKSLREIQELLSN